MNKILLCGIVLAAVAAQVPAASPSEDKLAIDARFRAKLMKAKVRQAAVEREQAGRGDGLDSAACGSQNIGTIDTGGNPAAAPRELIVYAPNAINIVSGRGCR